LLLLRPTNVKEFEDSVHSGALSFSLVCQDLEPYKLRKPEKSTNARKINYKTVVTNKQ